MKVLTREEKQNIEYNQSHITNNFAVLQCFEDSYPKENCKIRKISMLMKYAYTKRQKRVGILDISLGRSMRKQSSENILKFINTLFKETIQK